jgi:hypothetical protein
MAPDMSAMHQIGMMVTLFALGANAAPALAQSGIVPAPPYYAMTPSMPLTPYASSPLQQNYRSQLQASQRNMLLQNPSGLGRAQIAIGDQLNALDLPANPPPTLGGSAPAPFAATGAVVAAPPFDAAPPPTAGGPAR